MKKIILFIAAISFYHVHAQQAKNVNSDISTVYNSISKLVEIEFEVAKEAYSFMVIITDSAGNTRFLDHQPRFKGVYKKSINLRGAPKGKYYVKINEDEKRISKQFVIQ